jgi:hypothetical protein
MTSHYTIITSWIESCETQLQLDNLYNRINNEWILEDKLRDDLIDYWNQNAKRRAWVGSKVSLYEEEHPTDQCTH